MKKMILNIAAFCTALCLLLAGCSSADTGKAGGQAESQAAASAQENSDSSQTAASAQENSNASQQPEGEEAMSHIVPYLETQLDTKTTETEETETVLQMKIGDTSVAVSWEDNDSVEALKKLCQDGPLTIQMSMYGGFEQVGSIGQDLPRNDSQTTTQAGDIVLYSGNQIVVFYGSNSWAYTRLGQITDQSEQELVELLGNGDVTITINS